ncbi:MAG: class C sortase [Lachnospiraceae bacterium]|nr:class C sortase [Lachnospiraceae bacterium]
MAYPFIANYVFEHRQESLVETYEQQVDALAGAELEEMLAAAQEYNQTLASGHVQLHDPFTEELSGVSEEDYESLLRLNDTEVMGYINIPCISVELPIYHGTSAEVLEKGVGHLEGSSLPIGGEGTHTVLTGHTGLSRTKLFTDLTQLEEGDIFVLNVFGEHLAYEVDQIKVVEPSEVSDLAIEEGQDYCTLITCTPYGINSHRLLVRGVRTEYKEEYEDTQLVQTKTEESQWMYQYKRALFLAIGLIAAAFLVMFLNSRRRSGRH